MRRLALLERRPDNGKVQENKDWRYELDTYSKNVIYEQLIWACRKTMPWVIKIVFNAIIQDIIPVTTLLLTATNYTSEPEVTASCLIYLV